MPDASQRRSVPPDGARKRLPSAHPDLPNVLVYAFWALLIAAVSSVLLGFIQRTQTDWLRESARKRVEADPSLKMPTESAISSFVTSQLVGLILLAVVLVLVALQIRRGRVKARWYVAGIALLATLGVAIILPFAYLGIPTALTFITSHDAPIVMTVPICIAALAMTLAFAGTVTRPARIFFTARKAEDLALAEAAGKTQRQGMFATVLRPRIHPETQATLDRAGISTGRKRSKAKAAGGADPAAAGTDPAASDAADAPAKPSLSKSRAPAEVPKPATSTARRKGATRSR
jgi:hypothetical protein